MFDFTAIITELSNISTAMSAVIATTTLVGGAVAVGLGRRVGFGILRSLIGLAKRA